MVVGREPVPDVVCKAKTGPALTIDVNLTENSNENHAALRRSYDEKSA